jgi:hypothetical protein
MSYSCSSYRINVSASPLFRPASPFSFDCLAVYYNLVEALSRVFLKCLATLLGVVRIGGPCPLSNIPECQRYLDEGSHHRLYAFSPNDYKEMSGIWGNGEVALPLDPPGELEVIDGMPEGGKIHQFVGVPSAFTPDQVKNYLPASSVDGAGSTHRWYRLDTAAVLNLS